MVSSTSLVSLTATDRKETSVLNMSVTISLRHSSRLLLLFFLFFLFFVQSLKTSLETFVFLLPITQLTLIIINNLPPVTLLQSAHFDDDSEKACHSALRTVNLEMRRDSLLSITTLYKTSIFSLSIFSNISILVLVTYLFYF